jgi:voltage-gated potassium channel
MKTTFTRKLLFLLGLLLATLAIGTAGYIFIEKWSLLDSLFMTVITVSTIGYGESHQLDTAGRIFTIALIIFGTGVVGYGISSLTLMLFQGDLPHYLKRRKMEKVIARIADHIIICGLSRTGLYTLGEIEKSGHHVVVIEKNETVISHLEGRDIPYIVGDATSDENLLAAGIKQARALITCLTSDAENAFVVVTAKSLNPQIKAISKAETAATGKKLSSVGTDKVVIPSMLGGLSMANSVIRPETQHFFETLHTRHSNSFHAALVEIEAGWEGKLLSDYRLNQDMQMVIIALERPNGEVEFNPLPDTVLEQGAVLMVISGH